MNASRLRALLRHRLPARQDSVCIELAEGGVRLAGDAILAELHVRDENSGESRSQWVTLIPGEACQDDARVEAYLHSWTGALPTLLAKCSQDGTLPVPDGLVFPEALTTTAYSREQFTKVFTDSTLLARWAGARSERAFRNVVDNLGLADFADALVRLRRTSIRLCPLGLGPRRSQPGRSRLGGAPDLPVGMAWPIGVSQPMTLLAQIDLASAHSFDAEGLLPPSGLLQVFADLSSDTPRPAHTTGPAVRVLLHRPDQRLHPVAPPAGVGVLPARAVTPQPEESLPPLDSPFYGDLVDPDRVFDVFVHFLNEFHPPLDDDHAEHRLLGYADPVADDPWSACAAARPQVPADQWQLLLQVDSDDDPDCLLGDRGIFYVMIPNSSLRAGDLATARGVWQTH